jgi:hypothetical protein
MPLDDQRSPSDAVSSAPLERLLHTEGTRVEIDIHPSQPEGLADT